MLDPGSLAEGRGNKDGKGSPVGNPHGLIGGAFAKVLTWIMAFGSLLKSAAKKAFGKLKELTGKAKKRLLELLGREKPALPAPPSFPLDSPHIGAHILQWKNNPELIIQQMESLTKKDVERMIGQGLTKDWVQTQVNNYGKAILDPAKNINPLLSPRLDFLNRILSLWPK